MSIINQENLFGIMNDWDSIEEEYNNVESEQYDDGEEWD